MYIEAKEGQETNMSQLMEQILSRKNMNLAYKKVKSNKRASGVDGVSVEEIYDYIKENRPSIKEKIRKRKYKPQPILRVEIPKSSGQKRYWGLRKLGTPKWMAKQSTGFGDHYQAVAKTTGLHKITKEILAKRGLISCLDYYLY